MGNRKISQLFVFRFVAVFAACASDKDQAQVPGGIKLFQAQPNGAFTMESQ